MKTIKIITLSLVAFVLLSCGETDQQQVPEPRASYNDELQKLVVDYGNAMNNMASSSLYFGADTETEWAIDTVNQIWEKCQEQPFDFLQYMADIAIMEKFFAYGIDYVPMTFYWSKHYYDKDNLANYKKMFDNAMLATDSLYQVIRSTGNWHDYFRMHTYSLNLVDLYCAFFDDLNYWEPQSDFSSLYYQGIIDDIYLHKEIDPTKYALQIDGLSVFVTYNSFLKRFPDYDDNKLKEYANIFHEYIRPIFSTWNTDSGYQNISDSEIEFYLKTALPIYTDILNMMSEKLKNIPNE